MTINSSVKKISLLTKSDIIEVIDNIKSELMQQIETMSKKVISLGTKKFNYIENEIIKVFLIEQLTILTIDNFNVHLFKLLYITKKEFIIQTNLLYYPEDFNTLINDVSRLIKTLISKNINMLLNKSNNLLLNEELDSNILKEYYLTKTGVNRAKFKIIDLRLLFFNKYDFPTISKIKKHLEEQVVEELENYLIFPLFLSGKSPFFNNNYHGYFKIYYSNITYYTYLILIIKDLVKTNKIKIIIPNVMDYQSYLKWVALIKTMVDVEVGLLLDDLDTLHELIDHKFNAPLIVDLDYINNNNYNFEVIDLYAINQYYLNKMKVIRSELFLKKSEVIVTSKQIKCSKIVEKLVKNGFELYYLL